MQHGAAAAAAAAHGWHLSGLWPTPWPRLLQLLLLLLVLAPVTQRAAGAAAVVPALPEGILASDDTQQVQSHKREAVALDMGLHPKPSTPEQQAVAETAEGAAPGAAAKTEPLTCFTKGVFELLANQASDVKFEASLDTMRITRMAMGGWECKLRRYEGDVEAAVKVLAGKHLVLIGDSLTRYQYLSLVHFLEHGTFISAAPDSAWALNFPTWTDFFRVTNERLNGHEVCDCHRPSKKIDGSFENRYYFNPDTGVRITYLQWRGNQGLHVHEQILDAVTAADGALDAARAFCEPGRCGPADAPLLRKEAVFSALGFLRSARAASLRPHWLVLNCGHWTGCGTRAHFVGMAEAALEVVRAGGGAPRNVIWKMTTTTTLGRPRHRNSLPFVERGARVSPDDRVTEAFWVLVGRRRPPKLRESPVFQDDLHFRAPVYGELNTVLLNVLAS